MMLSRDESVRKAMRWFAEDERGFRHIEEDLESSFLNWKDEKGKDRTASLVVKTRKTCRKMDIQMKLNGEEMIIKTGESNFTIKIAVGIGRFLTQKSVRTEKIKKLIKYEVHGASFTTLEKNEVSNLMVTNIYT
jgi:hypothetical protein